MNLPRPLEDFFTRFGYNRPESFIEVDPDLIPLLANIASKEGLSLSETIHELLCFAVGEHHFTDENLALWHTLTNREKETAAFTCLGYTNHEIAQKMIISPNTVKTHLRRVLQKFGVGSKSELQLVLASWDFSGWDKPHMDTARHYYPDSK